MLIAGAPGTGGPYEPFRLRLTQLGYDRGKLAVELRNAEPREERFPAQAAELIGLPVDLLIATTTRTAQAARGVTATLPIVFMAVGDPVGQGFVASLARPGGNMTGLTSISPQLNAKRLDLLKEAFPTTSRIAVVFDVHDADAPTELNALRAAAVTLGLHLQPFAVVADDDYESLEESIASSRADAMVALGGFSMSNYAASRLLALSQRSRLPTIFASRRMAEVGGLMAYGPDFKDLAERTAIYVDKILRGAKPVDLPVEQPSRFDFAINLTTARSLGLALPQSILAQASELVQ
jgi:putative ABC transport system substrate-binding protein